MTASHPLTHQVSPPSSAQHLIGPRLIALPAAADVQHRVNLAAVGSLADRRYFSSFGVAFKAYDIAVLNTLPVAGYKISIAGG
jgi:hypothetical protein